MTLDEYIKILATYDRDTPVAKGLGEPDSWRGDYSEIAFAPIGKTTMGEMHDVAVAFRDTTMTGYKGGDYIAYGDTPINIDGYGEWTDGTLGWRMLIDLMGMKGK